MFSCELYTRTVYWSFVLGQGQLQVPAELRSQRDQGGALLSESATQQGLA